MIDSLNSLEAVGLDPQYCSIQQWILTTAKHMWRKFPCMWEKLMKTEAMDLKEYEEEYIWGLAARKEMGEML